MDLLAALARDLQADFLPHMDRVLATLSDFVDQGGDREPELLEHVFTCASSLCKHLCRLLVPDLVPVLYSSARLRYHKARHVRQMAAQSFGYLLRHAPPGPGRVAVRTVLADAATKPSVARIHGAAALIAEAVAGAGHGLHSRAPATLGLLLQRDILTPADFQTKGGKGKKAGKSALESAEQLEARVAAVAEEALQQVLNHVRRGPAVLPLWETVSAEVESRIDALESVLKQRTSDGNGAPSANGKSSSKKAAGGKRSRAAAGSDAIEHDTAMQSAKWGAARAVALLSSMLEYHRGSRVESYKPFFALAQRFAGPELCNSDHASKHSHATDVDMDALEEDDEEAAPFVKFAEPSLSAQVLRFLQALVYSHTKVVGASEGPAAIENVAPLWAGVFARAPAGEILRFVRALVALRGGVDATRCFVSQMLAAVGRCLLQGE